ncbi:MAG: DUF1800 family protein [Planctomycetes bacterium]|nr:DUF1800 family protein [Planctomycetota bacterium]
MTIALAGALAGTLAGSLSRPRRVPGSVVGAAVLLLVSLAPVSAQVLPRATVAHVLRRITFGPTPALLARIQTQADLDGYVNAQLAAPPTGYGGVADVLITSPGFLGEGAGLVYGPGLAFSLADLQNKELVLALESPYQLRELLCWFWEQHFSTYYHQVRAAAQNFEAQLPAGMTAAEAAVFQEWRENQTYRALAFADFRDLMQACVDSPAMRYYLNLVFSGCRAANEDFGREFLELHTMGPQRHGNPATPNYTTADIQVISEVFRGLDVDPATGLPGFSQAGGTLCHYGIGWLPQKTLFAGPAQAHVVDWSWTTTSPPSTGDIQAEIASLLDNLVAQTETKLFISTRLIRFFVGDADPIDPGLLSACVNAWGARGDIDAVLRVIFASPEFVSASSWERLENPIEATISQARLFGAGFATAAGTPNVANKTELVDRLSAIRAVVDAAGALPHEHPAPDGYPLASQRQVGSGVFWNHGSYAWRIYADWATGGASDNLAYAPVPVVQAELARLNWSWDDPLLVSTATLVMLYDRRFSTADRDLGEAFLNRPTVWDASTSATEKERRLRLMLAFLLTLPQALEK